MYCSVPVTHVGASPNVTESVEVDTVSDEIRRWSSLSGCVSYVSYSPCILLFSNRLCVTLTFEACVVQVFSRVGQLSEVNLDPDVLTDMVSIMVNNLVYKPSVKDIMEKYYEMFWGKNSVNKKHFFNSPDSPDHSDQDSDTDG